jgi:3D (Asp-Asp-Asp) domain-containing protein
MKKFVTLLIVVICIAQSLFSLDFEELKSVIENYRQNKELYTSTLITYGFSDTQIKSWRFTQQQMDIYFPLLLNQIQEGYKVFSTNINSLKAINDVTHELSSNEYDRLMTFIEDIETVAAQMRDERVKELNKKVVSNSNGLIIMGYNITYDGNGNTGGVVPVDENLYPSGSSVQLDDGKEMIKEGFKFMGWSYRKDTNSWISNQKIDITNDVTVYAVWIDINTLNKPSSTQEVQQKPKTEIQQSVGYTVYIARSGTKYHRANCRTLRNGSTAIGVNVAESRGYTACKICNP